MIAFAEVAIGAGGVVSCCRCGQPEPRSMFPAEQVADTVRAAVSAWRSGPGPNIAFVGAEPFAHPELPALISGAAEMGVRRIRLRTEAGALAIEGNAEGALHAGVRQLEVVLLGAGDAHDTLAGRPGLFEAASAGMHAYRSAAMSAGLAAAVVGLVPVCRHTLEHAAGAVVAFANAGAVAVTLDVSAGARDAVGAREHLLAAIETGTTSGVWVSVRGMEAEALPVSALHVVEPAQTVVPA